MQDEYGSYLSIVPLKNMFKAYKFHIECVQNDNGQEFTNTDYINFNQ